MTIRVLEEKHREVAAEIIRGTPRRDIAVKHQLSRDTIQNWLKDPLFQAYLGTLREEVQAARRERLMPVTMKAAEAVEALLARLIQDANSIENPTVALEAALKVLKIVAELEHDEAPHSPPLRASLLKAERTGIGGVQAVSPDERAPLQLPAVTSSKPEGTH